MTPTRVGIWGVFGHGNYGNEATLEAFLAQLDPSRFRPTVLTTDPERTTELHGVPAQLVGAPFSAGGSGIRRAFHALTNRLAYLRGAFRAVSVQDAIVIAGTGGLEMAGPFGTPFEIWALAVAARLRRRPYLLLDVGVDRLDGVARFFAGHAGRLSTYRSYRDARARDNMHANGVAAAANDPVVTDMAFALTPTIEPHRDESLVVVGVIDYHAPVPDAEAVYESYLQRVTQLLSLLTDAGHRVVLVVGDDEDRTTAEAIHARAGDDRVSLSAARTPAELTQLMSTASAVIATRYHTLIMSLLARTPVVSIGYSGKHQAMLEQFGLPDNHQDAGEFDPAQVAEQTAQCIADGAALSAKIDAEVVAARARLDAHWEHVFAVMESRGGRS